MLAPIEPSDAKSSMSPLPHSLDKPQLRSRPSPDGEEEQKNGDSTSAASLKHCKKEEKGGYKQHLRPRKIANYKDQFDISSSAQSDEESPAETNCLYSYGACVLPNSAKGLRQIIDRCNDEIKDLEAQYFDEEFKDSGTSGPFLPI